MAATRAQQMPPLAGRYLLLASMLLVLLPHILRIPLWLAVAVITVIGWRLLRDYRGWALPSIYIRLPLLLFGIGAVLLLFHTLIGREAGTALLTVLLSLKLLELRTLRDAMVALFLCYFLVVVNFFFDESIFTGLYMFLLVLALTATLIALNHPAALLSSTLRYFKYSLLLLVQSIPLMVLLFILFPRISSPLWHMPESQTQARTGLSDEMNLGEITKLADSDELAFRVEFNGPIPSPNHLYWRGPVLWNTDGKRWFRLSTASLSQLHTEPPQHSADAPIVSYDVTLEPEQGHWLFALDLPLQIPQLPGGAVLLPDFQLLSAENIHERLRYPMRSVLNYHTSQLSPVERHFALQLPRTANPLTRQLAERWRNEGLNASALVSRALDYFRKEPFYYTRQPPPLGHDPVDQFLFDTRHGFCEHYASSFVTLMRAAGVPARVVTGYQGGELNAIGGFVEVRQNRAHAWAEVWLDSSGWTRIDPTAVIPPQRVMLQRDSSRFSSTAPESTLQLDIPLLRNSLLKMQQAWGAMNYAWNVWVLGFDEQRQRDLLQKLGIDQINWQKMVALLFASFTLALLLIAGWILFRQPHSRDPVVQLYRQFCRKLAKAGVPPLTNEGPRDLGTRASMLLPDHARQIALIIDCYTALRYGREATNDTRELRRMITSFRP